ncbi:NAD(P)/FAD-dependent oxidoreductase [Terribacillus sp. DMT04]|uniref:NAD(P)/FAD-dependent oxidoreductase n=1 Tax=Terribacillus sp. DMT04 TaxID=2850441 RepID=UPI00352DB09B
MLDCAIIGGGPAGLNAALVLGRARRNIVLFDHAKPRNAVTHESHGFITRDGVSPSEFRSFAHDDLRKYPSITIHNTEIVRIEKTSESAFQLQTQNGETFSAKKVILATGLKENLPNVPGIYDMYGKSLFSCPYCDGWELRDQPLVLIAENKHGAHMAKVISQWSKDLIVCTNGLSIIPEEDKAMLQQYDIRVVEEKIAKLEGSAGILKTVILKNGEELARTGGFVITELSQTHHFASSLGYKTDDNGGIKIDNLGRTSIPGLYAAGDSTIAGPSQLILAAAHGSLAAIGVNSDLTMEAF